MATKRRRPGGTGSLFKHKADGPYFIKWRTHNGKRREVSTRTTDRAAAERILAKMLSESALRREGVIDARSDQYAAAARRPIREHVEEWKQSLLARNRTEAHARLSADRVLRIVTDCKLERLSDVAPGVIVTYLAARRRDDNLSLGSSNHYLRAIKGFYHWCTKEGRLRESPLVHVAMLNERTDRRHERRALTPDELGRLIQAAENGPAWRGIDGRERGILYRTAVETGLRLSELASLTVASFNLSADPPTVTVKAAYSKRRRDDVQPLPPELAGELHGFLRGKLPAAPSFKAPGHRTAAIMIRADLAAARHAWINEAPAGPERDARHRSDFLNYEDADGRKADFHALRHTFITNLARSGVHPKVAQALARHSTIELTMTRYTHTVLGDLSAAVASLPAIPKPVDQSHQRATGTLGAASSDVQAGESRHMSRLAQRETVRLDATPCDDNNTPSPESTDHKPLQNAGLCDSVRRSAASSRSGGIGRRVGFKIRSPQGGVGSSPSFGSPVFQWAKCAGDGETAQSDFAAVLSASCAIC